MKKVLWIFLSLLMSSMVLAGEKSLYDFSWLDKDKEIYVLQNRRYRKSERFYFGGTGVKTASGVFIDSYGGTFRGGYFFTEDWGLEVVYGMNKGSENDTAKGVKEQAASVPFYRKINAYAGGMVMWSPFYSKINTFNKILYFDWMIGAGLASITTEDNRNKFEVGSANEDDLTAESIPGAIWNTGFRFYINNYWSLRLDITGLHYTAEKTRKVDDQPTSQSSQMFSNYDLGIGLNYTF